jgi:multiple sugar transport system substrate-binding protein
MEETPAADPLIIAHFWQGDAAHTALADFAAEFLRQNPNTPVEFRAFSPDELRTMLVSPPPQTIDESVGKKPRGGRDADLPEERFREADVTVFDPVWLAEMTENAALEPYSIYSEYADESGGDPADSWGVSLTASFDLLFYNIEVLKAVGFERPPKDRKEFLQYARQLSSPGKYGWTLSLEQTDEFYPWIWSAGVSLFDTRDGIKAPNFEQDAVRRTLAFIDDLNKQGVISPNAASKTKQQKFNEFISGRAAMMIASVDDIETIRKKMGDTSFGVTTVPYPDDFSGNRPIFGVRSSYLGIRNGCDRQEEALAFISFISERAPALAAALHVFPGNGSTPLFLENNSLYAKAYDIFEGGVQVREFDGAPRVQNLNAAVQDSLTAMLENGLSPENTARNIQALWKEALR